MRAGRLRHRARIDRRVDTREAGTGAIVTQWVPVTDRDCELVPLSGRELIAAQAVQSEIIARAVIRHTEGIDPTMRLICRGSIYNIRAVLPDPTFKRYCTLMLSAGVNNGQ